MKVFKKSLIASLVCAGTVMAATSSNANELYGDIRYSVNDVDKDGSANDTTSFDSNAPRFGLKGEYDLGDGNKAFYHIQLGFNNEASAAKSTSTTTTTTTTYTTSNGDDSVDVTYTDTDTDTDKETISRRFGFIGIGGDWGKTMFGTASSPYKMAGFSMDPFYDTSAGSGFGGANYGLSGFTNGFFDNVVAYVSPSMGGATVNVVAVLDDSANDNHSYNPGVSWSGGGLGVNVQLLQVNTTAGSEIDATRIAVTYKMDAFKVGISMENVDQTGSGDDDYMYVTATYNISDKTAVSASMGSVDANNGGYGGTEGDGMSLGVFHNLHKQTQIYGLISSVDAKTNTSDRDVISFGLSQKFSIGG